MAQFRVTALSAERPFPGLRPFAAEDHRFFCGRDAQIYALYRLVDISRFVAVVGSSGSGKSSLVRAGLFPLLDEENAGGGKRIWLRAEMRPGNAPLNALVRALTGLSRTMCGKDAPGVAAAREDRIAYRVGASSRGIADALSEIDGVAGRSLVLAVDQFEELFRYSSATPEWQPNRAEAARARDEAAHFVQLLLEAGRSQAFDVHVLLTMRSDFIGDCARFQGLPEAVSATQFLVPSLTRDQREQVIRKPLEHAHASIESALVDRLLNDTPDELDQLPVLQHCLLRLWEKAGAPPASDQAPPDDRAAAPSRHLTLDHYRQIGGIDNALSGHANEILQRIGGLEPIVARLFRALSEFDNSHRAIRRARSFSQLCSETDADKSELREVLDHFRSADCAFLTTFPPGVELIGDKTGIDISHEALLRRWDRVRGDPEATGAANDPRPIGWMREEEGDGRHYQALLYLSELSPSDVKDTLAWWNKRPRTPAWAARYGGGYEHVQRLLQRGQGALQAEQARQRNFTRLKLGAMSLVCLLLAVSVGLLVLFYRERSAAQASFGTVLAMGDKIYSSTLNDLNRGDISSAAAQSMAALAGESIANLLSGHQQDPEVRALFAKQMLTVSDIYSTAGDEGSAYKEAQLAHSLAQQLVQADSGNADWQVLVYGALFRIADILVAPGPNLDVNKGLAVYQQAQKIAAHLAENNPTDGNRLYDLAFIDNKVGETYQQLRDYSDAMTQFNNALQLANKIALMPSALIEWQAYPASTLTKIGRALVESGELDQGIAKYDQAISMQETILNNTANTKTNNDIVSSNLLTTHRLKGNALLQEADTDPAKFSLAFAEYAAALSIARQLVDKDSGNANWLTAIASIYDAYGNAKKAAGDANAALQQYQQELLVRQKLAARDKTNSVWQKGVKSTQKTIDDLQASQAAEPRIVQEPAQQNSPGAAKP